MGIEAKTPAAPSIIFEQEKMDVDPGYPRHPPPGKARRGFGKARSNRAGGGAFFGKTEGQIDIFVLDKCSKGAFVTWA